MNKTLISIYPLLFSAVLSMQAVWAADYTNSIGMEFKNIPAGTFFMGSCMLTDDEKKTRKKAAIAQLKATIALQEENKKRRFMGLPLKKEYKQIERKEVDCPSGVGIDNYASGGELPQHKVNIANSFQIGLYEVTLDQFKKFILDAGRDDLLSDNFMMRNRFGDRTPVVHVSWVDTQDFVDWLNKKEGGEHYSLPTEAEWEYAARGGTTTRYWWGDELGDNRANCEVCRSQWDNKQAAQVGSFRPNSFGLYDTSGNVSEWVEDCYFSSYQGAPLERSMPEHSGDNCSSRVVKGGSWSAMPKSLRSAGREGWWARDRSDVVGFRLARTL